jgi:tellurite resistance protein TerC
MTLTQDEKIDPDKNPALRIFRRLMPLTPDYHGQSFFVRLNHAWHATPLFAALLVVEFSDVIFALDSIPAVIAITTDTFVVYTSNIFAIMGLRALFFLLANLVGLFRYLKTGISLILVFVGGKMIASAWYHVPTGLSLGVIAGILAVSITASVLAGRKKV